MSTQTQEYKNEQINVTVSKEPGCKVSMEIVATPESAKEARKEAVKNVRKEVSIPRFRKGKAPEEIVIKNFSKQIEREFRETFLNFAMRQAIALTHLYPWNREGRIKADINEASLEKGGRFKISFEHFPEVPTIEPEKITIPARAPKEVTESAINGHIESLRYQHAKWNEVEGRAVESGDFVEATVEIVGATTAPRRTHIHVHPDHLEAWMCALLIGKEKGFKGTVTPPEDEKDALEPTVKKSPRPLQITIEKISSPELLEVNDAFAEKFGTKSLEELREKVKEHLRRKEDEQVKNEIERAVQKKLLELYRFDMPESIITEEAKKQLDALRTELRKEHSDDELKALEAEMERVAKERADHMLRTHYLLYKVADQEKFEINDGEIFKELMMMSMRPDGSFDSEMMQHPEKYSDMIRQKLRLFKAIDFIAQRVNKA